jgi:hypothetical protein
MIERMQEAEGKGVIFLKGCRLDKEVEDTTKKPFSFAIVPPDSKRNYFLHAASAQVILSTELFNV